MEQPQIRDRTAYKQAMNELLRIDPARTVVLTIDMQMEYLDPDAGGSPVSSAQPQRVISYADELLTFSRSHGIPVIHAYVSRRPVEVERGFHSTPHRTLKRGAGLSQNARVPSRPGANRLEGTPQAAVPDRLVEPDDIHVTTKRATDAYHQTDLDMLLGRVFKPETVVLTGINTDTCVYATTFATSGRGYQPVVISDCVASSRGVDHHWMALELMSRSIAWVLTVEEFRAKVGEGGARPTPEAERSAPAASAG